MLLTDTAVTRPVFATVLSLLLVAFGAVSFFDLPLREYPNIDPPVVSVDTNYRGASASVIETRITEVIEDRISGIQGIRFINSRSSDGRSRIDIEFDSDIDIDSATNDVRDRVGGVVDNLPEEADPPEVQKSDSSDDVIMWLNLTSDHMNILELTDYAKRYLQDRFSVLPGVARVRVGGGLAYAMRVWIDTDKLAARQLTVSDIESALRTENVELPAGSVESEMMQFTARIQRAYMNETDFRRMVIGARDGVLVRLGDVARVEKSAVEKRTFFRGNGVPMVGIGIIKQSTANTLHVAEGAKALAQRLKKDLPEGMKIHQSYDTSVFIQAAIAEVYKTLFIAILLVVGVIFIFLGSPRAMLIPAVTVPVSLVASFSVLWFFDFSLNLLTLLALVLAIGLVVDDAIVVLENIYRRIEEGESPLKAAFYGVRQVSFAVLATTVVLVSVFVPITFVGGDLGRLFSEFSITLAAAVMFSTFVALTLCPVLASKLLKPQRLTASPAARSKYFVMVESTYMQLLDFLLKHRVITLLIYALVILGSVVLYKATPTAFVPKEDRGAFFLRVNGPEGASFEFMESYMDEIEKRLMPYVDTKQVSRLLVRAPRGFGVISDYNSGIVILVLKPWHQRRPAKVLMKEMSEILKDLPGVRVFPIMRQGLGGGVQKPVQFVIGGGAYEQLAKWRDTLLEKIEENNPGLTGIDSDYKETKPQLRIVLDKERAADLGVSVANIGSTLETLLGSRRVTTYIDQGEEYDVLLEAERHLFNSAKDLENIYVRSSVSGQLVSLANIVTVTEIGGASSLNRYNRTRAITIQAGLSESLSLGEALNYLRTMVRQHLPAQVAIDYKGESLSFQSSGAELGFVFLLGACIVFLVLAAQFESFIHPFIIILTVPLALAGAMLGIYMTGNTLNLYTQIGLIMLMGLAAKNGILIVEFANQLRDQGMSFRPALLEASRVRLRPIIMTGVTTLAGAIPLIVSFGAGAEARFAVGVVVLFGVASSTLFTLIIIPAAYDFLAQSTQPPETVKRQLIKESQGALL